MALDDRAIVVGIDTYPDIAGLEGAERDAMSFYDWLTAKDGGDVDRALTGMVRRARGRYGEALALLRPDLPRIVAEMTPIEPIELGEAWAEYAVMKVHNGQARVHLIPFVQGTDGVWHIESM